MNTNLLKTFFVALFLITATGASAHDFYVNGIYYNITDATAKTVEVTYKGGSCSEYDNEYTGSVVILSMVTYNNVAYSVTSIGSNAFWDCRGLTGVTIPNSVTSIGYGAFRYCTGLTSITIPNNVTSIGNYAFQYCDGLTGELIIPSSVTSIGGSAFAYCTGLTGVTIPNSVTSIGDYAFQYCDGLTGELIIPNSVTSIGGSAFAYCRGLTGVTIPNSVTSIGYSAFYDCTGLEEVHISDLAAWCKIDFSDYSNPLCYAYNLYLNGKKVTNLVIPDGVTEIKKNAFSDCSGLTSITIPNSVTSIGYGAFRYCRGLTSVTIGNSVTSIGDYAFRACYGLTSIVIPNSVTSIGNYAFYDCSGLTGELIIPNSVTSIGEDAFFDCDGLTSVTIGSGVTSIGYSAFSDCTGLKEVHISDLVAWCKIDFANDGSNPLCYAYNLYLNGKKVTNLVIPDGVTEIKDYTFYKCRGLTSITIPNSVTSIGNRAFYDCSGLKEVHISDLAAWCKIDFSDYSNPLYYAHNLYLNGKKVTNLVIPDGVTEIKDYAFSGCRGLTSITIPNSVTGIGSSAFSGCTGLKTVYNLSELTLRSGSTGNGDVAYYADKVINAPNGSIEGDYIFDVLDGVNTLCGYIGNGGEITLPADYKGENYVIGANAFNNNTALTSVEIPNSVTSIEEGAFYNTAWYKNQSAGLLNLDGWLLGYKEVKPTGVLNLKKGERGIAVSAFKDCTELTGVVLGNSVTSIGNSAFSGCTGLINITIPNSVTSIGSRAFSNCSGLTSITIPNSVTSIGDRTFSGCSGLTSITIPNSVTSIGEDAFSGCRGLTSITIPNSVTSIGSGAFFGCSGLTSITIPNSVTSIGEDAFRYCTGLKEVRISDLAAWCKIDFEIPSSNPLCYAHNLYLNGEKVTNLVIPDGVTEIKDYAFSGCRGLTSITIPNSVTGIGSSAFSGCTGLTSVTIGNSVTSIRDYAFSGCRGLTSIEIPNSVTSIGGRAFEDCTGLKEIYSLSETPATISSDTFSDYSAMLYVPLGAKGAYQTVAYWKNFDNIVEIDVETGNVHYPLADWVSTNKYDNTTSSNTYSIVAIAGSVLSFDWQVSSESGYDWFIVTLDGAEIVKGTGEDSGRYTYKFAQAGTYDLTAKYVKDDGYSKGEDCGKIYNILLTSPTDIDEIEADDSFNGLRDTYYDLKGSVVENPTKGIYIYNGKKVLVQ